MKHQQLRALVAIAETGSMHAAARALCVSQPAISKAIRELESSVGLTLLMRNATGVSVTAEGAALLQRARLIVRELERATEEMAHFKGARDGRLLIGVTPLAGMTVLPQSFAQFRRGMPGVKVDFLEYSTAALFENLRNGMLDFALAAFTDWPEHTALNFVELDEFATRFAVRRDSRYAGCTDLAQLQEAEWLHTDPSDAYPNFVAALYAKQGLPPPAKVTRCASQSLFYGLLETLDAVVTFSSLALDMPVLRERMQALPLTQTLPPLKLMLLVREGAVLTGPADYFIHCIRGVAGS